MENPRGIFQSKESESSSSPTQPESTPSDNVATSDKDQSQSPADIVPPIIVDVDAEAYELTSDGKRKYLSVVWNHLEKKTIKGEEKAICNYCSKPLAGKRSDGTSHLQRHFQTCKRRPYRDIRQSILLKEQKKADGSSSYLSNYHFDPEKSRKDLASMIIIHEYPLSIVDHLGFRAYPESLQPLFKVPSRNTIKSDIIKIYENEKSKTMGLLDKIGSKIALTSDMWTASNQKKGYMTVTAHYINDDWDMQSRILRFVYVECPHTAEIISDKLVECMVDWNIDRKLSTITLDNCNTNDCDVGMLLNKLDCSTLMLDGQLFHMRCCAHILNLIAQDGLSVLGDGIEKVRNSVAFWTATPKRDQGFREAACQIKVSITKKLILDCKTRWNSTYHMLVVALAYKDVFTRLKTREPLYTTLPTPSEWETAKEICSRLEVFNRVTEMFSGTQYLTTNIFFPLVCEIKLSLKQWETCSIGAIKKMASKMIDKFDKYWSVIHGIMGIATILDPRYKMRLLEYFFPLLYGSTSSNEINYINQLCFSLFEDYQTKLNGMVEGSTEKSNDKDPNLDFIPSSNYLAGYDSFANDTNEIVSKTELDLYLEENVLPRSATFDILGWWKTNGIKYPTLQHIAKDILAIPISTVASESTFSTGGRLLSPHRSRLHEDTLEALMCAQSWMKHQKEVSIGIIGPKQYLHVKDKRLQSFQDPDSEDEDMENIGSGVTTL